MDDPRIRLAHDSLAQLSAAASDRPSARRAPDNELYDRGCDLVEAAAAIRRVADAERASAAARSLAARALATAGNVR